MTLCLATVLAAAGCTTMEKQIQSSGTMGQPDQEYVNTAYVLVQLDDEEGKLAATKASDPRVRDLATQIMAQADALSPGLQAALHAQNITPPDRLPAETTAAIERLRGLSGPAFDRQYVMDELAIHQRAVPVFQKEDTATQDGAMRTQVETELPAVQDNLAKLQALSSDYGQTQG